MKAPYREIPYNYTSFSDREIILRVLGKRAWEILETLREKRATGLSAHMLLEVLGDIWVVMRNPYIQDDLLENEKRRYSLIQTMRERLDRIKQRADGNALTLELVEIIRILSDQKIFQFVLSMHKKESEYILSMPHFKTRLPKKIEVSNLTNDEVLRYIQETLVDENLSDIYDELKKSHFNLIIEYSQNNFRTLKQLLSALFSIIYQAQSRGLSKYSKINKHTITMAAIDLGLLNVKS